MNQLSGQVQCLGNLHGGQQFEKNLMSHPGSLPSVDVIHGFQILAASCRTGKMAAKMWNLCITTSRIVLVMISLISLPQC